LLIAIPFASSSTFSLSTKIGLQILFQGVKIFLQLIVKKVKNMQQLIPINDIRTALQDRRLTVVAERCGLSHPTVKSIATGNEQISLTTWKKLSEYLSETE